MAKFRMDLIAGVLEIEGEEQFIREVYVDFKGQLTARAQQADLEPTPFRREEPKSDSKKTDVKKTTGGSRKDFIEVNKNLDLYGNSGKKKLADFYKEKSPSSAVERNAVFVYYLSRIGGIPLRSVGGITVFSHHAADERFLTPLLLRAMRFGGQAAGTTAPEVPDGKVVVVVGTRDKL